MDVSSVVAKHLEQKKRDEVRQEADAWCRRWQRHRGLPEDGLPRGVQGNGYHCVFANALGGLWDGDMWQPVAEAPMRIQIPECVKEFIRRFDRGEYPDLSGTIEDVPEAPNAPALHPDT